LLEDKLSKEPIVKLPAGTKLLPPKHNETLVGVKTNKKGEIVYAKYSTGKHTYFEGVHAHPSKVKFLPPEEAPKHALAKVEAQRKRRKTLADLEKLIEAHQATISSIESTLCLQNRCFLRMHEKVEDIEKNNKELEKHISALEPPKSKK
jgi:septal ring factor EnvC (AmiA/AmiB activator)